MPKETACSKKQGEKNKYIYLIFYTPPEGVTSIAQSEALPLAKRGLGWNA